MKIGDDRKGQKMTQACTSHYVHLGIPRLSICRTSLKKMPFKAFMSNGGRGEIRTHGRRKTSAVFKTAAINRALPPFRLSMTVAAMPRGKRCIYVSRIKCKAVEALPPALPDNFMPDSAKDTSE